MDPNETLRMMKELARGMVDEDIDKLDASGTASLATRGQELAELVLALDGWVTKGGFLPKSWLDARKATD